MESTEANVWKAAYAGALPLVRTLVEQDPRRATAVDEDGRCAIHWAASRGSTEVIEYLLQQPGVGAGIDAPDEAGWTPLMIATSAGHADAVRILLEAGASVNAKNENGQTSLHYAASRNRTSVAKLLLEKGADVNAQDHLGAAPLHRAASLGHLAVAELLLKNRAAVNLIDHGENTPLHAAMSGGQVEVASLLIMDFKADVTALNKNRKTPVEVAPQPTLDALRREGVL